MATAGPRTQTGERIIGSPVVALGDVGPRRSPGKVWLLTVVTLGVYGWVMHYRINDELYRFTQASIPDYRIKTRGWAAVLLYFVLGPIEVVVTTGRVRRVASLAGIASRARGFVAFLAMFVGANWAYQQLHLNRVWNHMEAVRAAARGEAERVTDYLAAHGQRV